MTNFLILYYLKPSGKLRIAPNPSCKLLFVAASYVQTLVQVCWLQLLRYLETELS